MTVATLGFVVAILMVLFYNTVKVLKEYERGVVFFLGRFQKVKGPGLILLFPIIQVMTKVDLRVIVMDVPTQDVISRDNVSVKVNAVIYFRIVDPEKAVIRVANVFEATSPLSQTTLRSVLASTNWTTCWQSVKGGMPISGIWTSAPTGASGGDVEIKHVDRTRA
jgi:regulator of protease activity HflC (stomatin/prohibitin superfamily)